MSHFSLHPNDTALRISNGGVRTELPREVAAAMIDVGDTFSLPGGRGIFQMRRTGSQDVQVQVGKNAQGVKPPMRFSREHLEV